MVGDVGASGCLNGSEVIIAEELLVRGHPVGEADVEERSELELPEDVVGEAFIIHGRHDIAVEEHELLDHVEHQEGKHSNWEQDRHAETIEEGDVGNCEDGRVLVVHEVDWAFIGVDIALNRSALSGLVDTSSSRELAATVEASEEDTHSPVTNNFDDWVVDIEDHCTNNNISNSAEPGRVEVGKDTIGQPEADGLLGHIGVGHQEKEGRVEELHDEGHSCDVRELLSLSLEADPGHEHDADSTKDIVDTDEEVRQSCGPEVHGEDVVVVVLADLVSVDLAVGSVEGRISVNLVISLAHALESSAGWHAIVGLNEVIIVNCLSLELVTVGLFDTGAVCRREDGGKVH